MGPNNGILDFEERNLVRSPF